MRTIGALNKPKFCNISLADLNKVLQENASIPVDIRFAAALGLAETEKIILPAPQSRVRIEKIEDIEKTENIQFNKIEF